MLIELRCNVMARDFFNYIDDTKHIMVYMNGKTLYKLIDQIREYKHWGENAVTTDHYVDAVKKSVTCYLGNHNTIVKYDPNVPNGYMRVEVYNDFSIKM